MDAEPYAVACPHAPACPGCPGIGLPLPAQHAGKSARLARALARHAELSALRPDALRAAASPVAYRTRAKLAVAPGPRVGLYARGGHEVVDIPSCRVLAPVVVQAAAALRGLLANPPPPAGPVLRAAGDGPGLLHAVDLREVWDADGVGVLVTWVLRGPAAARGEAIEAAGEALARALPALRGLAVSMHDGRSPRLLGGPPRVVRGPVWFRDRLQPGAPYTLLSHGTFAQAHRVQGAALHEEVRHALGALTGRRVLDLYAGSGGLALGLAASGARVVAVEAFVPAAEAAERAAREQGLAVEVRAGGVEGELPRLRAAGARFDAAVVNPPRRGVPARTREALSRLCDGALVYVSCEPETLARDLAHLAWLGWRAERAMPFDLMPLTDQVECVVVLRRASPPAPEVLYADASLVAVAKPPHLPTVPHPEHAAGSSLLERVRALPGAAKAVPLHRLDAGTSGVCLFARSPEAAPWLARALATSSKRYLALVRGVARPRGRVARPLREQGRARAAATRYRRLAVVGGHALLEVVLESGRTHQIRRHLAAIGQPVLGDDRHGHAASNRHLFERHALDRPFLHCAGVSLPELGIEVEAPLAVDLAVVLERLGGNPTRIRVGLPGAGAVSAA
jgi:23S rRNA (uracil1939-C5)-methyltransferase